MIACVVIPYFVAAVERRVDARLLNVPLVITENEASRRVFAISAEAAQRGVRYGLTFRQAQTLCPDGQFLTANPVRCRETFDQVVEVLSTFTHRIELDGNHAAKGKKRQKDTPLFPSDDQLSAVGYIDVDRLHLTQALALMQQIIQAIQEQVRLTASIGLASGKFPARIAAASVAPSSERYVAAGEEAAFLSPLPVTLLPLDEEMSRRLRLLGIETLGQLANLPAGAVSLQFGKQGYLFRQLAAGRDHQPLVPYVPKSFEHVIRQLDSPASERAILDTVLHDIADELAACLHARASMGRELELIVHLDNGSVQEDRLVLRQPVASAGHIAPILSQLLAHISLERDVTQVEARLSDLVPAVGKQLDLFVHEAGQEGLLRGALKDAIARYGGECFHWISLADPQARLPGPRFKFQRVDES